MDSASCCKALSDALKREFGILYKKNMDGMSELLFAKLEVARANALKLRRYHADIGNDTPSSQCPCTTFSRSWASSYHLKGVGRTEAIGDRMKYVLWGGLRGIAR